MIAVLEMPRLRPGANRRDALRAVVNTGHDSGLPERFHAVIYTTGINSVFAPEVDRLRTYVEGRYWTLSGTYFDEGSGTSATERPGLSNAVAAIHNGQATALVIDEQSYDDLSPTAREWLRTEIERFGGFLTSVSHDGNSG